ncbi:PREDICTED: disintegrin and metalloproteinase domain-containing protein 18-like [Elephantulus edwardii]|uniref:disintegrin and metalloproteinase domain-containing protein 18-like n=1 Tax=Elephantulus edwardii TaxID=28737 RepID=UPI0003F070D0|nr:PREDICTED: disintegrin and metalloproteinase domain-containing protein 18-like [Elephantulus edwardii]
MRVGWLASPWRLLVVTVRIQLSESPFVKFHCFYQGCKEEIPKSIGLLELEKVSYGIESLQSSSTYEHIIYQIRDKKMDFNPLERNYSLREFEDQFYRILVKSDKYSKMCRKSKDPCDFPEYCNGTFEYCPAHMRSADLEPGLNYTSDCYEGVW